jgi:hypothetical protein
MTTVSDRMTLARWRGMSAADRGRWAVRGENGEALAALAQSDGVTLEEAVELFAWRQPILWKRREDAMQLDRELLERVRCLADRWREPGTPEVVGESVLIAGWHYDRGRDSEPMSGFPDARRRDASGCPLRAAEIAVEFIAAARIVWLESAVKNS